ncbi:hypothetical protein BKA64DRAFT_650641 [Cadophora sp. MPI-SDFR-AT-0126]|nr:hypothetical protein BKA64DRAFT_650641 [Leotiomycetes sp. MPI-SDFR-AT-0126]
MASKGKSHTETTQISDLAFNVDGWALEDKMVGEERGSIINARCPSSSYLRLIQTINNSKTTSASLFRSTQSFTAAEIAPSSDHTVQYLIVGYALRSIDSKHDHHNLAYKSGELEPVGSRPPCNVIPWKEEAIPVLIVTPMACVERNYLKFFALMEPKNGLCTPYIIRQDKVFFRAEFRSTETTTNRRRRAWSMRISDAISKLRSPDIGMVGSSMAEMETVSVEGGGEEPEERGKGTCSSTEETELVSGLTSLSQDESTLQEIEGNAMAEAPSNSSIARALTEEKTTTLPSLSDTRQVSPLKDLTFSGRRPDIPIDWGLARKLQVRLLLRKAQLLEERESELAVKESALEARRIQLDFREKALQEQRIEAGVQEAIPPDTRKDGLNIHQNVPSQRKSELIKKMEVSLDKAKVATYDPFAKGVKRPRESDDDLEQEAGRVYSGCQNYSRD